MFDVLGDAATTQADSYLRQSQSKAIRQTGKAIFPEKLSSKKKKKAKFLSPVTILVIHVLS